MSKINSIILDESTDELSPAIALENSTVSETAILENKQENYTEEKIIVLNNYSDYLQFKDETAEKQFLNIYTVNANNMPMWYVDNDYVLFGYRRITNSYLGCIKSLLYLHNETGNIYTHGIGALAFIFMAFIFYYHLFLKSDTISDFLVLGTFFIGAITCLGLSTAFHLCCCHSKSVSLLWNKADYLGIVILIFGSFIPVIYYGFFCDSTIQKIYLTMIMVFGCATIGISVSSQFSTPQYRYLRTALFTSTGLSGIVPLFHAFVLYGFPLSIKTFGSDKVMIMGLCYVLGALIYSSRVPERWWPGRFDICGHSHQIFHCLVLLGAAIHFYGIMSIHLWWHENNLDCSRPMSDFL